MQLLARDEVSAQPASSVLSLHALLPQLFRRQAAHFGRLLQQAPVGRFHLRNALLGRPL